MKQDLVHRIGKYLGALVVVLETMACSSADMEEVVPEADVKIGFGVTMSSARSLIERAGDMASFKVWGWRTARNQTVSSEVFDGTTVAYDDAEGWVYSPPRHWMPNHMYDFYAFYPDTISGLVYNENGELSFSRLDIRQNEEYNRDEAVDLMHASQQVEVATTPPEKVHLTFNHLLTNVNFSLKKDLTNANDVIVVTSIVVGGMNCIGSMVDNVWTFHDTETSYFYTLPNVELDTDTPLLFSDLLMIPQTLKAEQPVVLIVQYNYIQENSNETLQKYQIINLPTTPGWKADTKITYKATISVDKNISFSTPVVESWGTEQVGGTIVIK